MEYSTMGLPPTGNKGLGKWGEWHQPLSPASCNDDGLERKHRTIDLTADLLPVAGAFDVFTAQFSIPSSLRRKGNI